MKNLKTMGLTNPQESVAHQRSALQGALRYEKRHERVEKTGS